ncbi:MAG: divalent metal cation transporter [Acidobacteria bacterium]|nr:divalent metal cation transporter [Acidobacteriota bacterium]
MGLDIRGWLRRVGPGLVSGASNDDPSAIVTYVRAGAAFGYGTLWAVLLLFPMMATAMFLCGKLALTSGRGLAGVLREHYGPAVLRPILALLVIANVINAGADIGAIAEGLALLAPVSPKLLVPLVALALFAAQAWCSYRVIANVFRWLALTLLAYVGAGILAHPDAADVLRQTFVPRLHGGSEYLAVLVAMVGTALSPYLMFWQSTQRVEEEVARGHASVAERRQAGRGRLRHTWADVLSGSLLASVAIYFVILASGATLHARGQGEVSGAAEAARALEPVAGRAAAALFAAAFIGAGVLAVPVLVSGAAYALAEALRLRRGLTRAPSEARRFYATIAGLMLVATALNYAGLGTFRLLFAAAVINGLLAPPLLALVLHATGRADVVGARTNGPALKLLGGATVLASFAAAAGLVASWLL